MNDPVILVCGGRDFVGRAMLETALDNVVAIYGIDMLVHGGAPGADELAGDWAKKREHVCVRHPAKWLSTRPMRAAGPIRNEEMLKRWSPHIVVAFPGGRGTEDMVGKAVAASKLVIRVVPDRNGDVMLDIVRGSDQ